MDTYITKGKEERKRIAEINKSFAKLRCLKEIKHAKLARKLNAVNEELMPVGRCRGKVEIMKNGLAPIMALLKGTNVSIRFCQARDLVDYSFD